MTKSGLLWAVLAWGLGLAGCEGSDAPSGQGPDGGAPDAGGEQRPAWLVGTRVWDVSDSATSYFHVIHSLDEEIDPDRALEVAGAAKLYSLPGIGWLAFGGGEDPTITRYTLSDDDQLIEDERISLQPYGVTGLWDTLYLVSPTKLYYPDRDGRQLIIINPTAMTIDGTIDLADTAREGYLANYGYSAIEREGKLLITVGWFDWNETDSVLPETGLAVIDTESDTLERFDVDDRCGGITQPVLTASGDVYLASSALAAAAHELDRLDTAPCALRIRDGEDAIDRDYLRVLSDVTGAALAGEPVPGGDNDVYLRVLDEDLATIDPDGATWEITGQLAWRWASWDVDSDEITPIEGLDPATSDVVWFDVDGRIYGTQTDAEYSETKLFELLPNGEAEERLTAPGFMHGLAKIR